MAKNRRKPSATQRDKYWITIAKELKASGIISKQAKLHGGKFISKEVLRKAKDFEASARLNYGTVKVDRETAQAAKARGYQVVQGTRIIGPKTPTFRNRLKSGKLTGVKPVKGGMMEEVTLPHNIYDIRTLMEALGEEGFNSLKLPTEHFAFKYKWAESYRAFRNNKELLDYLQHYKGITGALSSQKPEDLLEEFDALTLFRLHPYDIPRSIPGMKERHERNIRERIKNGTGRIRKRKKTRADRLANMPDWKREKILNYYSEYDRKRRAEMTPAQREEYRRKAAARARASRERNK